MRLHSYGCKQGIPQTGVRLSLRQALLRSCVVHYHHTPPLAPAEPVMTAAQAAPWVNKPPKSSVKTELQRESTCIYMILGVVSTEFQMAGCAHRIAEVQVWSNTPSKHFQNGIWCRSVFQKQLNLCRCKSYNINGAVRRWFYEAARMLSRACTEYRRLKSDLQLTTF